MPAWQGGITGVTLWLEPNMPPDCHTALFAHHLMCHDNRSGLWTTWQYELADPACCDALPNAGLSSSVPHDHQRGNSSTFSQCQLGNV